MSSPKTPESSPSAGLLAGISAGLGLVVVLGLLVSPLLDLTALTAASPKSPSSTPAAAEAAPAARGAAGADSAHAWPVRPQAIPSRRIEGEVVAQLTDAPEVPARIESGDHNVKVIVHLEVIEKTMRLADGVDYTFWTFGGKVPGKFIRVREGDQVEFHLHNHPDNKLPHNIDLHAVTGPGGGAEASLTAPGSSSTFSFRVINPGLYVYHCATAPVPLHIANGMYGLILVEPFEGLPPVDREFYVMQSEFYTPAQQGAMGLQGLQPFDQQRALDENPSYVVFNGSVGANAGPNAMKAKVGDRIRLFVGNGGPNLISSFHVIGEVFDKVYIEGGSLVNRDLQTTLVPAGGSAICEFAVEVPGTLNLVDHSIFRTFNKGTLAQIVVEGEENHAIYTHKQATTPFDPRSFVAPTAGAVEPPAPERSMEERMTLGQALYAAHCAVCHQAAGTGIPNAFPPLAGSDYLKKLPHKGAEVVSNGLQGAVTVNGVTYNSIMPPVKLTNDELASVLTYINNSWGNANGVVTPAEAAAGRK